MPISNTGVILEPSATALLAAQQILINSYGPSVNLDPSSPNGFLIQNIALAITQREADQADTVNAMNPNIATGTQLDAICSNLNIFRTPATNSTANVVVTGLSGVVIPDGSQVTSTNNDTFLITGAITIGAGGTGSGIVTAQNGGPILVDMNTIINITQGVNGWDTINNPMAGTLGSAVESDSGLRSSRVNKLGTSSSGSYYSVLAGAANLDPMPRSYYLYINYTAVPVVVDAITIPANATYLVLDTTATHVSIAQMLFQRLSAGSPMAGNTTYNLPIPNTPDIFVAQWQTPTHEALVINITLKSGASYPVNSQLDIATKINAQFNFNRIGQFIYANEFVTLLAENGYNPILNLTFNVGTNVNLTQFTMPINQTLDPIAIQTLPIPYIGVIISYG